MSDKKNKVSNEDHSSVDSLHITQGTKKAMSTEDIIIESSRRTLKYADNKSSMHGKASMHNYSLHIPSGLKISKIVERLKEKISVGVVFSDEERGQLLVQQQRKTSIWDCLDCLLLWKMQGSTKGPLANSYNAIAIRINQDVIEQRCTITVKPTHPKMKDPFFMQIIQLIESEIKNIPLAEKCSNKVKVSGPDEQSPLFKEITAYKTIQKLIFSDDRYRTLFQKSNNEIKQMIIKQTSEDPSKKNRMSALVQQIVNHANSLYNAYTYDQQENSRLHPQYSLYALQSALCYNLLPDILKIYTDQTLSQNKIYNEQCQLINEHFDNQQCWKYLECRDKYTLPSQRQPYFTGIVALRQVSMAKSIRQMLLCVQKCFSQVKLCCLIEHKGNLQLATMDDILPVMVYIVVRAGVHNFPAYVKLIDDYIRARGTFELQERVITTLYVAVQDITKKWAIKSLNEK